MMGKLQDLSTNLGMLSILIFVRLQNLLTASKRTNASTKISPDQLEAQKLNALND